MKQIISIVFSLLWFFNSYAQSTLNLKDLQQLQKNPSQTSLIKNKGYKYLHTINVSDKIYIGTAKDTISIYYKNITWSGGSNNKSIFDQLKLQASKILTYDKEYSNALLGDEPQTPVFVTNYSYFSKDGIEHTATITYTNKTKKKILQLAFYVGESE